MGLGEMEQDEECIDAQGPIVDGVEAFGVMLHLGLGDIDQSEVRYLVNGVESPSTPPSPGCFLGKFPVIPAVALVFQEWDGVEAVTKEPDRDAG